MTSAPLPRGSGLRRGTATVTAAAATAEDARLLDVSRGDPMLVERRVILDGHGRPVEATESRYPADRDAIDVRFAAEETGSGSIKATAEVAAAR